MAWMNKSSFSVLVALSFIILKVNAKQTCVIVRVDAEYFQLPLHSSFDYEKIITTSSSFRRNYDKLATSASISGSYKLFSASAQGAYESVTSSAAKTYWNRHTETSELRTFSPDFLQLVQKITRSVTISGKTAKTETREIVDSIPKSNPLTSAELRQHETDYITRNFGYGTGTISGHTYTESKCIQADYEETGSIYLDGGDWGNWGSKETCTFPHFVNAMELKVERRLEGAGDDTALNAIRLTCSDGKTISSTVGPWGDWKGKFTCSWPNYIEAAQIRKESEQGSGDDTAANGLTFWCTNESKRYDPADGHWGNWSPKKSCPPGSAVMGLKTQYDNCGNHCDDTALNDVEFYCAKFQ